MPVRVDKEVPVQLLVSPTANKESVNNPFVPPIQPAHDRSFHGIGRLGCQMGSG